MTRLGLNRSLHPQIMFTQDQNISPPNIIPTRTDEGITRDDIDAGYMSSYNMRLIKIYHKDAELHLQNVVLENAGVSDDVDYNTYLAKYLENSPFVVSTRSSSLERILLDPGTSSQDSQNILFASSLQDMFCDRPQKSIENIPGGIGKHHGGAIFFSGKLLDCTGCHFRNNRVTGNGGALFIESVQPGRVVIDPDMDFYADDSNYANRIDLQAAGIPELATFRCNNCIFEDNLAMSVSRGTLNAFESLTGGFGGAVSVGTGIRYKVLLEQARTDRIASVRRAFGSHGSVDIFFNESQFIGNYAWKSGGAINVLGGRSVAKKLSHKISN